MCPVVFRAKASLEVHKCGLHQRPQPRGARRTREGMHIHSSTFARGETIERIAYVSLLTYLLCYVEPKCDLHHCEKEEREFLSLLDFCKGRHSLTQMTQERALDCRDFVVGRRTFPKLTLTLRRAELSSISRKRGAHQDTTSSAREVVSAEPSGRVSSRTSSGGTSRPRVGQETAVARACI